MERITDKDTKMVALEGADEISELLAKTYNKLMLYENIEEELGIDLVTLFKTKEIYWRNRYIDVDEYSDIKKSHRVHIDLTGKYLRVYETYSEYGYILEFNDYGKTWALTKEELENGQV